MKARRNHKKGKPAPVPAASPPPPAGGFPGWAGTPLAAGLLLFLLTFLAYLPALHGGFIWDDEIMVSKSPMIRSPEGLYTIWCTTSLPDFFPLTSTSLWLEWRLWGMDPLGYHVTNLLLHAGSVILLWRVLRRLNVPGAWLVAAVFGVHPVNVESVAWIAQRKNTLAMFFYAATLLAYLKFDGTGRRGWYWFGVVAFVLALLSKTSVAPLPAVLLLCIWWRRGTITRRDAWQTVPFFAAAAILSLVTIWFQNHRAIGGDVVQTAGLAGRAATAGCAVWFYIYKALLPLNLAFIYPHWEIDPHAAVSYLPLAALVLGFVVCWKWRQSWGRAALFGLGYFVVMLLPVLGFFDIYFQLYSLVADHWQYFSLIGVIAMAVALVARVLQAVGGVWFGRAVATAVLATLSALTWSQTRIYASNETIWQDTLAKNPACWVAHSNFGLCLKGEGDYTGAEAQYRAALKYRPDFDEALDNLGALLIDTGRADEAIEYLQKAVGNDFNFGAAHHDLGIALVQRGRFDEAMAHFRAAIKYNPNDPISHNSLGNMLVLHQEYAAAMPEYEEALRLNPAYSEAHNNMGYALENLGRTDEALSQYREAVRLQPDYVQAHFNLGNLLARLGRRDEAVTQLKETLRLDPENAKAKPLLQKLDGAPEQ
jgi:tetratricopeptide (TPR) repeat protein